MNIVEISDKTDLIKLLEKENLPTSDIELNEIKRFFGVYINNNIIGAVGLEIYKDTSLLRSLVINSSYRGKGLGKKLIYFAEDFVKEKKIKNIFLLTSTAEKFFLNQNYKIIERSEAPKDIKSTSQFSSLCPSSSSFMMKNLNI